MFNSGEEMALLVKSLTIYGIIHIRTVEKFHCHAPAELLLGCAVNGTIRAVADSFF